MKTETLKYHIILREGENINKRQYFPVSKEQIKKIFNGYNFDNNGEVYAWMGHIAGNDTKHGELADELFLNNKRSLLEFRCKNEQTANKCVAYFKLPLPFPNLTNN